MVEITRIAGLLETTFEGNPYYGPSVLGALEHVTADIASRKIGNAHSIWELVVHMSAELDYACHIIEGTAGTWIEGKTTWPMVIESSVVAWNEAIQDLKRSNRALVSVVKRLDETILDKKPIGMQSPFYMMLHGTIQHNIYHAGQISILNQQVGG